MKTRVLFVMMTALAGLFVIIVHELVKAIVFYIMQGKEQKVELKGILRVGRYIDPMGILFCVVAQAGFSRPYPFQVKDKRVNTILGITGFLTFIILMFGSVFLLKAIYPFYKEQLDVGQLVEAPTLFCVYTAAISLGSLFMNLFPVVGFDMGLLIQGRSPLKYLSIISNDYLIKIILLFSLVIGVIQTFASFTVDWLIYWVLFIL